MQSVSRDQAVLLKRVGDADKWCNTRCVQAAIVEADERVCRDQESSVRPDSDAYRGVGNIVRAVELREIRIGIRRSRRSAIVWVSRR
jgi:hypothetical protein